MQASRTPRCPSLRRQFGGLWHHPDFLKLWTGQTISLVGTQITALALPLTAILRLHASAAQMGYLQAAQTAPFLLLGLFVGVLLDRVRRKPVMLLADLGRAVVLVSVPVAAAFDVLQMGQLYVVAFTTGVFTLFFDLSYRSFLPSVVERDQLVEGNSKLSISNSIASVGGPGIAGAVVQLLNAPLAIVLDALSYLVSAAFLLMNRAVERMPASSGAKVSIMADLVDGLKFVFGTSVTRTICLCTGMFNVFFGMSATVYLLYMARTLVLRPEVIGLVYACGGVGALVGAALTTRLQARMGVGATLTRALLAGAGGFLLLPLASRAPLLALELLIVGQVIASAGSAVYSVGAVTLLQVATPPHLIGRMTATTRVVITGAIPVGAVLGGALGTNAGLAVTLLVAAGGMLFAAGLLWWSPVRKFATFADGTTTPAM